MASAADAVGQYRLGGVFSKMFAGIVSNILPLGGIALVSGLVAGLLTTNTMSQMATMVDRANPMAVFAMFATSTYWLTALGGGVVGIIAKALSFAILLDADEPADLNRALSRGAGAILPLIGLTIVWWLGVMLGYVLLFVPALILMTMWSVSAPALVAERPGVTAAFGRSRALTKGLRWPIFGTLVVFLLFYMVIAFALQGFSAMGLIALYQSNPTLAVVVAVLSNAVLTLLLTAFLAALYREVVAAKEGHGAAGLAEVFA